MIDADDLLSWITGLYWGAMLLMLGILLLVVFKAVPKGQRRWPALLVGIAVPALFIVPVVQRLHQAKQQHDERQARYLEAKAVFDEQCKTAGEKIYRTVEGVEGVMLLKVRGEKPYDPAKYDPKRDPMWEDAAAAWDAEGDEYVFDFLKYLANNSGARGYSYVDVRQADGNLVRYRGEWHPYHKPIERQPNPANPARYAITYSNNVDPTLRKYWVAGTTIQIIDQQTHELLAEKTVFSFDSAQGSTATDRSPWLSTGTEVCPHALDHDRRTIDFVDKVLISSYPARP